MKIFKTALAALLLVTGAAELSAQSFFLRKEKGMAEVKFLPPAGGQFVQLFVDDQPAGTLPVTVFLIPGPHKFTFSAPGEESKTIVYPVKGDTVVPSVFTPRGFPLTVNTNVPNAFLTIDGAPFSGNSTSATPGPHTLTVSAPGFDTITLPFNQPRNANTLNVSLIANTFPLVVNTNVPGAFLAIDGNSFGGNTTSVAAGPHTLSVSAPGYQPLTVPFNQPRNANTLNVTLIGLQGTISVNVDLLPRGAGYRIFINGNEVRRPGPQTFPAGTYQVRVVSGGLIMETMVTLNAGQDLQVAPAISWSIQ
jgi:hypothetical protein